MPGKTQEVIPFNPDRPTICVPLNPGNQPVHERWEIINMGDEDHSFHIHQVRFAVLAKDKINGQVVPGTNDPGILHDSIPLKHGSGDCERSAASDLRIEGGTIDSRSNSHSSIEKTD